MEKNWEYIGTIHHLFIDFEKAYDSVRREHTFSLNLVYPWKKLDLISMVCLNETYSKVDIGKHSLMHFWFRMVWNKKILLS
jgi:hypothetical protein